MKNKSFAIKALACTLCVTTAFGTSIIGDTNVRAMVKSTNYSTLISNELNSNNTNENNLEKTIGIEKDETVYAKADADGKINNIIVSDWIKNNKTTGKIKDCSDLNDIVNIKGDETFTKNTDGTIEWDAKGKDIYYQGTTTKELPVSVKVTYKLDDKEMNSKDIEGKTGHLSINLEFTNNAKYSGMVKKEEVYTPFSIVSAMMLDNDVFTNVKVEHAKIISDGDKQILVGVTMPGLDKSLGLTDSELSNNITVEADVKDYEPAMIFNVATAELLAELDLDDTDKISELSDSFDKLTEASTKLVNGSNDLYEGLGKLNDKSKEYTDGVSTLVKGVNDYTSGVSKATLGMSKFSDGSKKLQDGATKLDEGANSLNKGLGEAKNGMNSVVTNASKLEKGAKTIDEGIGKLNTAVANLETGKKQENTAYENLEETVKNNENIIKALKASNANPEIIAKLEQNTAGQKKIYEGLKQSGATIEGGISQVAGSTKELAKGATTVSSGMTKLQQGNKKIQKALNSLFDGSKTLTTGSKTLKDGIDTLANSVKELITGTKTLDKATTDLKAGGDKLTLANTAFKEGIKTAYDGSLELKNGMKEFNDTGITKLTDVYNDELKGILDKADVLQDAAKEYNTFTKIDKDMSGNVKFVIEINCD